MACTVPDDVRRPAIVTEAFREAIARRLAPMGFEARAHAKSLVRKHGKNVHRIDFSSSHYDTPGYAVAWPALWFQDAATRKLVKGWRAGGSLTGASFAFDAPTNVASATEAEVLADLVVSEIAFFIGSGSRRRAARGVTSLRAGFCGACRNHALPSRAPR